MTSRLVERAEHAVSGRVATSAGTCLQEWRATVRALADPLAREIVTRRAGCRTTPPVEQR